MPYLIVTYDTARAIYNGETGISEYEPESSRAVATLEEARQNARNAVEDRAQSPGWTPEYVAARETARGVPESGGTIGPLPDGTVIEVKRVLIDNLIVSGGLKARYVTAARYADTAMSDADVIDAYNARHA